MECADKFEEMDDDESESISDAFVCCICRDLLFKPVVLACGHISCFWCVHKSMSVLHKSRCPVCRNQYLHFPCICRMLHLLLLKLYPKSYRRRELQILDEEMEMGTFSPEIDGPFKLSDVKPCSCEVEHSLDVCSARAGEKPSVEDGQAVTQEMHSEYFRELKKDSCPTRIVNEEGRNHTQVHDNETEGWIKSMLSCGSCKEMLVRPVVLNCGHVFCICCIAPSKDMSVQCEVCQIPHPGDIPKVCLEFDHFLEEKFPQEYGLRRDKLLKQGQYLNDRQSISKSEESCSSDPLHLWSTYSKVHIGAGCDSCGMYPIVGDRYRCKDCVEQIGFDLCKDCYTSRSKLPGRFNQQHTSEHKFEIVKVNATQDIMLRLLQSRLQEAPDIRDASVGDVSDIIYALHAQVDDTEGDVLADPPENSPDTL